jgi:anti-sigma factor ChrR (cupin superfamily)
MLSCRDVSALATEYAEGALPPVRRLAIWLHLTMCRFCRRYAEQLEITRRLLRLLPPPPTIPAARRRNVETFRRRKRRS